MVDSAGRKEGIEEGRKEGRDEGEEEGRYGGMMKREGGKVGNEKRG